MKKLYCFLISLLIIVNLSSCDRQIEHLLISLPMDEPAATPTIPENSSFEVHYIDVGQADAALVLCDNKSMLIDGGNAADSDVIAAYLKKENISTLDYAVCTHAHEDHVGGLSGALSVVKVNNVLAPRTEADTKAYQNFKRKASEQGLTIQHPEAGDSFALGSSNVQIIGPITEYSDDLNNTSIVMKLTYGNTSFLFAGDADINDLQGDIIAASDGETVTVTNAK